MSQRSVFVSSLMTQRSLSSCIVESGVLCIPGNMCIISCLICLRPLSLSYMHICTHSLSNMSGLLTAAVCSSLQQLANPVNHNVMSIQFDILVSVSQTFDASSLSLPQNQCTEVIALSGQLPASSTIFSGTSSVYLDGPSAGCAIFETLLISSVWVLESFLIIKHLEPLKLDCTVIPNWKKLQKFSSK